GQRVAGALCGAEQIAQGVAVFGAVQAAQRRAARIEIGRQELTPAAAGPRSAVAAVAAVTAVAAGCATAGASGVVPGRPGSFDRALARRQRGEQGDGATPFGAASRLQRKLLASDQGSPKRLGHLRFPPSVRRTSPTPPPDAKIGRPEKDTWHPPP